MRVVVAATADVAIPTLDWLRESEHNLIRIVTTPDSKTGRGRRMTQSSVANWADKNSIKVLKPSSENEMLQAFQDCDIAIAIAYGKILSVNILAIPKYGFLNLHFSLLPAYRGAAPVQRAILNGEKTTGYSIFQIDENLDTGPIFAQEKYQIDSNSNSADVLNDLSLLGSKAFATVLSNIEKRVKPTVQGSSGVSFAPKISKEEARINWNLTSYDVLNLVRAFTPLPGPWTTFQGAPIKITQARASKVQVGLSPGVLYLENRRMLVGTSDDPIEVSRLIPAGKKEMSTLDWLNGVRLESGAVFE